MNYTFDIIDTQNDAHVTQLVRATESSVIVEWMGGDRKDDLFAVGSRVTFTMIGMSREDGQFSDLFTGDETRYKVVQTDDNGNVIMSWFLLPDSYSEPYTNSPILIDFEAVDGIGRLKGKYLPDSFYEEEKSVIEILSKCLELTGLGLNMRFAPAIENSEQKDYNLIYIDTRQYIENKKKKDAHVILEDLLKDMVCIAYQADNYWNIEGHNIRNFRVYQTKVYSPYGELLEEQEVTRLRKNITGIRPATLTMTPPYGIIEVRHEREPLALPETIATEKNDGWVIPVGKEDYIYATDWIGHEGFNATAEADNGSVNFFQYEGGDQHISFRNRPYIKKGGKYKLQMNFEANTLFDHSEEEKEQLISDGFWTDPFIVAVRVHYTDTDGDSRYRTLYLNEPFSAGILQTQLITIQFNEDQESSNTLYFTSNYSGLLDVMLYGVHNRIDSGIGAISITEMSIEEIAFEEEYLSEITKDGYTLKKEVDLKIADDSTGMSTAFRLQKLRVKDSFSTITIPIRKQFYRDGYWYAFPDLKGANLIKDNIDSVYELGNRKTVIDVIYNYNNSQDHAVKLLTSVIGSVIGEETITELTVDVYDYNGVIEDRTYWEQWTDSKYGIERKRYPDVVSSMYHKMFKAPYYKLEFTVMDNIKFNDFVNFDFMGNKQFIVNNCRWDVDRGFTDLTLIQAFYEVEAGVNLAPVVEIGADIFLESEQRGQGISCEAYDPDGFIASFLWEELTNNGATLSNPNAQTLNAFDLTGDFYTFKVTVTDNDGATATDTVNIYRNQIASAHLEMIYSNVVAPNGERHYKLIMDPDISEGASLNIKGFLSAQASGYMDTYARAEVYQNGILESEAHWETIPTNPTGGTVYKEFSLSYLKGDEIVLKIAGGMVGDGTFEVLAGIETAEFIDGFGTVDVAPETIFGEGNILITDFGVR